MENFHDCLHTCGPENGSRSLKTILGQDHLKQFWAKITENKLLAFRACSLEIHNCFLSFLSPTLFEYIIRFPFLCPTLFVHVTHFFLLFLSSTLFVYIICFLLTSYIVCLHHPFSFYLLLISYIVCARYPFIRCLVEGPCSEYFVSFYSVLKNSFSVLYDNRKHVTSAAECYLIHLLFVHCTM